MLFRKLLGEDRHICVVAGYTKWQTGVRSGLQEIPCPFWKLLVPHRVSKVSLSQLNPGLKYSLDFVRSGLILSSYQRIGFTSCFFSLDLPT